MLRNWLAEWKRTRQFARINKRKSRRRVSSVKPPLQAEVLEDRTLLSSVSYTAATDQLNFDGTLNADTVSVSSPAANTLQIDVGMGDTISLADDALGNSDFVLSNGGQTLTIDTNLSGGSPVLNFTVNGLGGNDTVTLTNDLSAVITGVLTLNGDAGDDTLDASLGQIAAFINGGADNDTLIGGSLVDVIDGGTGNDTITGGSGADSINGGDGDDLILWNNGDGSDVIDGGIGTDEVEINTGPGDDTMLVTSAVTSDHVDVERTTPDPFVLDISNVETIDLNTQDGNDTVTVADLSAVGSLTTLNIDTGSGSDSVNEVAQIDGNIQVVTTGGEGDDTITGTPNDDTITGGGGNDTITGGDGNDTITGGAGDDMIDGGAGNDTITGGTGDDTIAGGTGDDLIIWNDGDGSDTVDGGVGGNDTLQVNGGPMDDDFHVAADGVGGMNISGDGSGGGNPFTLNATNVETLDANDPLGGNDTLEVVNALAGVNELAALDTDLGPGNDAITINGDPDANSTLNAETLNLSADITGTVAGTADVINVAPPGTIQDALDAANTTARINIAPAVYPEVVNASATGTDKNITFGFGDAPTPATGIVGTQDFAVDAGDVLEFEVNGVVTPGVDYDQLVVTGTVTLTGSTLETFGTVSNTSAGDTVVLIDNDGTDAVVGEFNGLAEGSNVVINGEVFTISYQGGTGNDVVLVATGESRNIRVIAAGPGMSPTVQVRDATTNELLATLTPYDPRFAGGVRVAVGDVTGDGIPDIITGPGPGGGPHIKVIDGDTHLDIFSFFAFDERFTGGVFVAAADVNGDHLADIIVGADAGGGPHVKVFSGADLFRTVQLLCLRSSVRGRRPRGGGGHHRRRHPGHHHGGGARRRSACPRLRRLHPANQRCGRGHCSQPRQSAGQLFCL